MADRTQRAVLGFGSRAIHASVHPSVRPFIHPSSRQIARYLCKHKPPTRAMGNSRPARQSSQYIPQPTNQPTDQPTSRLILSTVPPLFTCMCLSVCQSAVHPNPRRPTARHPPRLLPPVGLVLLIHQGKLLPRPGVAVPRPPPTAPGRRQHIIWETALALRDQRRPVVDVGAVPVAALPLALAGLLLVCWGGWRWLAILALAAAGLVLCAVLS